MRSNDKKLCVRLNIIAVIMLRKLIASLDVTADQM